ncbi:MAG: fibronectin type III domain-containing protein [Deltaproteobacteria bacterium]|nr:fibronectin type III domain-containing protein [Deltaproteobacteria bacterium]
MIHSRAAVMLFGACLATLVLGCPSETPEGLIVHVQTDLVPGLEIDRVSTEIDGDIVASSSLGPYDSLSRPTQVANAQGLPHGLRRVRVTLHYGPSTVAVRDVQVEFRGSLLVNVVVSRSCSGVVCDEGQTCVAGQCAEPSCATGFATDPSIECPPAQCVMNDDCGGPTGCVVPTCALGVCLDIGDDSLCARGERCVADLGCLPIGGRDAGPPDAWVPGPPPRPTDVVATTVSSSEIAVTWTGVGSATGYQVERARDAAFTADASTTDARATSHAATGLPQGTRFHFRVRALRGGMASEWSDVASAVTNVDTPGAPSLSVTISEGARAYGAGSWIALPDYAGNWYFAQGDASVGCPPGTSPQFRWRGQYTDGEPSPPAATGWMGATAYMVRPLPSWGVRFWVAARCVGPDAASAESGEAGLCRTRESRGC